MEAILQTGQIFHYSPDGDQRQLALRNYSSGDALSLLLSR